MKSYDTHVRAKTRRANRRTKQLQTKRQAYATRTVRGGR